MKPILIITFIFIINSMNPLCGQKGFEFSGGGGLVLHPILCDTYVKYDSTANPVSNGTNSYVSFKNKSSITWMAGGEADYYFNKYFSIEGGLCFHKLKMSREGNPDSVLKYSTFSNNPGVKEDVSTSVFSIPVGLGLSLKRFTLYTEILFPIYVNEVTTSIMYDDQIYKSENNTKHYYKRLNIKICYSIPINEKIQIRPFFSWYNTTGKCPNNFFIVGFEGKWISRKR
ncbi:MAG: outer membrane beta-barrel protein [Bacteroidia bacterium]